jgi:hypothetical protein
VRDPAIDPGDGHEAALAVAEILHPEVRVHPAQRAARARRRRCGESRGVIDVGVKSPLFIRHEP